MELDADAVENIRVAGRLADVGMIGIRDSVLNKPGRLTAEEMAHVRDHVRIGVEILSPLRQLGDALAFVHEHHEHWDGSGYPRGLIGENISLGARIVCAADTYDALTSKRAWREGMSQRETIEYLAAHAGALLDPAVYAALKAVVERNRTLVFIEE
jgi:HD-GYP domain-containing protein (c-di-GMP phosphodiesterase class II)